MKRLISILLSLMLLAGIGVQPAMATDSVREPLSMSERTDRSSNEYSLEDLAMMRLTAYGIMDGDSRKQQAKADAPLSRLETAVLLYKTFAGNDTTAYAQAPFRDVPAAYIPYINWAYAKGITSGITAHKYGTSDVTQRDFLIMLLRAAGHGQQVTRTNVFSVAKQLELSDAGIGDSFTVGDAALYLQRAIQRFNIPHSMRGEQMAAPRFICLYPQSVGEIEGLLKAAIEYAPEFCFIRMSGSFSKEEMLAAYRLYRDYQHQWETGNYKDDVWYATYLNTSWRRSMSVTASTQSTQQRPQDAAEQYSQFEMEQKELREARVISQDEYRYRMDMAEAEAFFSGQYLRIQFHYSEAWKLICDADDAFALLQDSSLAVLADEFYQRYRKQLPTNATNKQKIVTAKTFICAETSYDYDEQKAVDSTSQASRDNAHSILGFLENRKVVCDGYARLFQYIMTREGIECILVLGSTTSRQNAASREIDHAWNKVKLNGKWSNMDVCWADHPKTSTMYDLRTDAEYAAKKHWPSYYHNGPYAA